MKSELTIANIHKVGISRHVGKNKKGNIVIRRGFFYKHKGTAEKFADEICKKLHNAGIEYKVIDKGEHWASFRGGASLRNQSHWWVELAKVEKEVI